MEIGDLLFTGSGETKEDIGRCIVFNSLENTFAGGDVIILKQNKFDSMFIAYSQNSKIAIAQKSVRSKGDIIVHIYASKLKDLFMPYPSIKEQKEIVNYIQKETASIDLAIAKTQRELDLVREYKESLITEAVTGQLSMP